MKAYKGVMRPSIIMVTLVVLSVGLYFMFNTTPVTVRSELMQTPKDDVEPTEVQTLLTDEVAEVNNNSTKFDFAALDLTLLAAIVANPINQSSAVIQFKGSVTTYKVSDKINQTALTLVAIYNNYVVLVHGNQEYELRLSASINTDVESTALQALEGDAEQKAADEKLAKELAKKIGNRPKELEHIVIISPASDGYYVTPGLNPALFRAARFKEGDVIQGINGKNLNDADELAQARALIATAETLEFNVLRGSVSLTLYLDIPSQDLSISRE